MSFVFQSVNEENDLEFAYEDADEFNTEIAGETMVGFVYGEPGISKGCVSLCISAGSLKPFLPCNTMSNKILCWLICSLDVSIGPKISKNNLHKIAIIFLSISLNCVLGAQKNRLIETVLLNTHNICFG